MALFLAGLDKFTHFLTTSQTIAEQLTPNATKGIRLLVRAAGGRGRGEAEPDSQDCELT